MTVMDSVKGLLRPMVGPARQVGRRVSLALFRLAGRRLWRAAVPATTAATVSDVTTSATAGAERVLVVRLDEIGDMVLLSPFLQGLRELYPRADITLVTKPACQNLAALCPHVDRVLAFAPAKGRLGLPRALVRAYRFARAELTGGYTLAIAPRFDADASYMAGAVVYMSGATRRVGYGEAATAGKAIADRGFDSFYTELVPVRAGACHEVVRSLDVLRYLGYTGGEPDLELYTDAAARARAAELLAGSERTLRIVVALSTGSPHRLWPPERYAAVMQSVAKGHKCTFILVGGDSYAAESARYLEAECLELNIINIVGQTTLRESAAVMQAADLYLGGDTGMMHMAAAAGLGGVVISCHPQTGDATHANSPVRFGPWHAAGITVLQPAPHHGCEHGCNSLVPHCILNVTVDMVVTALESSIAGREKG